MSDESVTPPHFPGGPVGLRALRLMARKSNTSGVLVSASAAGFLMWPRETSASTPMASVDATVWALWQSRGWLQQPDAAHDDVWCLTDRGRQKLRAALSQTPASKRNAEASGSTPTAAASERLKPDLKPEFNPLESPVGWLARRGLISPEQLAAGERLRADFTIAGMTARVTTNYDMTISGTDGARANQALNISDASLAASARVRHALRSVGPELAQILTDVCCLLQGLEYVERKSGWPLRSGKVVLQLALTRLARHYGLSPDVVSKDSARPAKVRHWGAPGYRPTLDGLGE